MSHALATVLHRGRKAASNIMSACLASSRDTRWETGRFEVRSASPGRGNDNSTPHSVAFQARHQLPQRRLELGSEPLVGQRTLIVASVTLDQFD